LVEVVAVANEMLFLENQQGVEDLAVAAAVAWGVTSARPVRVH
jgi:hypothetical protein